MPRSRADFLVLLAAFIWGVAFYFQKSAMAHVGPLTFVGCRALIAALALAPFAWRESFVAPKQLRKLLPFAAVSGLSFFLGNVLQQQGIVTASVTNTAFLTGLYVIFTPFLLWLFNGERLYLRTWCAAAVAFAGIWLLGGGRLGTFGTGDALVAVSSVFWSLYMVATSAGAKAASPVSYTCASFCVVAILAAPAAFALEAPGVTALLQAAPELLYVGLLSSAFTFALLSIALRHIPGSRASILLSTELLFAAATGYVALGEHLGAVGIMGAVLILVAILLIQLSPQKES